jgi:hypothetical protein
MDYYKPVVVGYGIAQNSLGLLDFNKKFRVLVQNQARHCRNAEQAFNKSVLFPDRIYISEDLDSKYVLLI